MFVGTNINTAIGLFCVLGAMLLGLLSTFPAIKAFAKGRNFLKWYIFSLVLFPVAFVASFAIKGKKQKEL
jgi:hypothetical protein